MDKHHVLMKERLPDLVSTLSVKRRVVAPVAKEAGQFAYEQVGPGDEIALQHKPTILPPKKFIMPQSETIQRFDRAAKRWEPVVESCPETVVLGIHTCDLAGIACLDMAMNVEPKDVNYLAKRDRMLFIAIECNDYCDEYASCASMRTHMPENTYDLLFTDIGDRYFVETGSSAGEDIIAQTRLFSEVEEADKNKLNDIRATKQKIFKPEIPVRSLQTIVKGSVDSEVWKDVGSRCLSCGNCTNVCPTCYCFTIGDELELDLNTGARVRTWDSCQNEQFAMVAGGENFRAQRSARQRHRYMRKFNFPVDRYNRYFCVGCGRCSRGCMAQINMKETLEELADERRHLCVASPYHVRVGTIRRMTMMTDLEMYFEIELDGEPMDYGPGQFVMVSVPGIGEAPISISSSPYKKGAFELVIRRAGVLTEALHAMSPGETVGIRGPYGRGFPVDALQEKDLVMIGGGCGNIPLHSLIDYVMHRRDHYGKIDILLGCRNPQSMLFTDEFGDWKAHNNVHISQTVDVGNEQWKGHVGLITALIPEIDINPETTHAVVVGPPVMYKFVIQELKKRNLPDEQIIVSLERHMKCGVGKCGRCQIGDVYCCQDGPVFTYAEIKDKYEALDHE